MEEIKINFEVRLKISIIGQFDEEPKNWKTMKSSELCKEDWINTLIVFWACNLPFRAKTVRIPFYWTFWNLEQPKYLSSNSLANLVSA